MGKRGVGSWRRGGQPQLPLWQRKAIRTRLRRVRTESLGHLSDQEFADTIEASTQAVATWLDTRREKPVTPGTTYIVRIATEAHIQPTWLLLGEGAETVGTTVPVRDLGGQLRAHLTGVLAGDLKANPEFVAGELPAAVDLLREVVGHYRGGVEREVKAQREFIRNTKGLLARALAIHDAPAKAAKAKISFFSMQQALQDFAADEEAMRQGKPPVEPPADPAAEFVPSPIPPLDPATLFAAVKPGVRHGTP